MHTRAVLLSILGTTLLAGCGRTPELMKADPEQSSQPSSAKSDPSDNKKSDNKSDTPGAGSDDPGPKSNSSGDPLDGHFTLADALKGIPGTGALVAKIDTSLGAIECKLLPDKAPITVANFVGLAMGKRPWKNGDSWVTKPAYNDTGFHRIIKGFMIQGGDPKGNGSGEPGYVIKDEVWEGAKHNKPGLLCMANRGPNTNGAQFFITDASAPHLDRSYTIFGECGPEQTIHDIASVKTGMSDKPLTPVTIKTVTIAREKPAAEKKP